ncbi:MAG: thymidylate kinase [Bacteroidales bacterium]|nr:thymidylate kinase [Bacteroidales bacterium]
MEGIDGSGKSTQIRLLMDYLEKNSILYRYIHFPRTDSPYYGELIGRFLRGDFGDAHTVDPYLVALLYAGDRKDAAESIRQWLEDGFLVLLDRYVYSNIAFQCAKVADEGKRKALRQWILHLEYEYFRIPRPDLNILLDVPFSFTMDQLSGERTGSERAYLNGYRDIHENDLEFQKRVREMYLWQAQSCNDMAIIECVDGGDNMLPPEAIFNKILKAIGFTS